MSRPHKCPVCDGAGKVFRPPWVAGDAPFWNDVGIGLYDCNACSGTGIVWGSPPAPPVCGDCNGNGACAGTAMHCSRCGGSGRAHRTATLSTDYGHSYGPIESSLAS